MDGPVGHLEEVWLKILDFLCLERVQINFDKFKRRKVHYPPMLPDTRKLLEEFFAPRVVKLQSMIGRDLSIWKSHPFHTRTLNLELGNQLPAQN